MTKIFAYSYLVLPLSRAKTHGNILTPRWHIPSTRVMLSCSAFFRTEWRWKWWWERRHSEILLRTRKNRSFDRGLGYEPTRLPISDFDNFSPHFYRMRSSSCRTRVTGRTYETSPYLAQTSIKGCEILRQMKKLFCVSTNR